MDGPPPLLLEIPKDPRFGDVASPVALGLAKVERRPPRAVAETILAHLDDGEGLVSRAEIAGPGYLNFTLSPRFWQACLGDVEAPGYPALRPGVRRRVLLEFVSANPTGPLHVGHGRGAVLGDVVGRLLTAAGHEVAREYYVNDAGRQMDVLGESTLVRLLQACGEPAELPEDAYPGDYLVALVGAERDALLAVAAEAAGVPADGAVLAACHGAPREAAVAACGDWAGQRLLAQIRAELAALGVGVDDFVSERVLHSGAAVDQALADLRASDLLYDAEGALWFRSTRFGDEKDRVVRRSNGEFTYFAGDIAYHRDKLRRGYDELIDVWGADHHGYVKRVAAAIQALGLEPERLHVLLVQMVRLTRGGEPVKMGKRAGEFVTLGEVVAEVGADAARFFYLMRKADSQLDFDLELATRSTSENPVFYVQYAHARICSVFKQAERASHAVPAPGAVDVAALAQPEERELIKLAARLPDVVDEAVDALEPHRLVFFAIDLASAFHRFYNQHRIVSDDAALSAARLALTGVAQRVLRTTLDLLGVTAPETM